MKKFVILLALLSFGNIAFAEKYPVKITPAQIISTSFDEIETGDTVKFTVANDVFKNGNLFITKGTPAKGKVDYIDENGWAADHAEILIKNFKTTDINGNVVSLSSSVTINGFEELKNQNPKIRRFWNYLSAPVRGKEIDINPETDNSVYNLWLEY